MLLKYKNEITILYSGGYRNTYFETKLRNKRYGRVIRTLNGSDGRCARELSKCKSKSKSQQS